MTEIENFRESPREFKIPMFDKKTSDFCFEKSREILNKPMSLEMNSATLDKRQYDKKTRDLIGENLLDIEKTLNALNLDFLQAFNELEKTDSAETLFGENFLLENGSRKPKTSTTNFKTLANELDHAKRNSSTRDYYAPLDRLSTSSDKSLFSPKDQQKTPPNCFSPQEATITSRGSFFNTNSTSNNSQSRNIFLSPTNRMFTTSQHFTNQMRKFEDAQKQQKKQIQQQQASGPRQRSLSFTENLELKPSLAGMKLHLQQQRNIEIRKTGSLDEDKGDRNYVIPVQTSTTNIPTKPRSVITYKPKSIRARNLRRLSYNPLNMVITSSSSSESEIEQSIAHSECDIRSKMYSSRFQRRRQQYSNRKLHDSNGSTYYRANSHCSNNSSNSNVNVNGRDKLYGSNASIKSAPHYNYMSARKKQLEDHFVVGGDNKTSSSDIDSNDNDFTTSIEQRKMNSQTTTPQQIQLKQKPIQNSSNLNNIYDFVGKCFNRTYTKPFTPKFVSGYSQIKGKFSSSNLDLLYADFDVSRMTGKSPTAKSYFDIMEDSNLNKKQILRQNSDNKPINVNRGGTFQWPEKIDGSTVKQNDLIWQLQQQHEQDLKEKEERRNFQKRALLEDFKRKSAYSSESSSTENDSLNFRQEFMPPSPAP
jgi:hypothetical protein